MASMKPAMPLLFFALALVAGCSGDDPEEAAGPAEEVVEAGSADVPEPVAVSAEPAASPGAVEPPVPVAAGPEPVAEPAAEPATPEPVQPPAAEGVLAGEATAIESATIMIGATRVMLYGLESVYPPQDCYIDGQVWECWAAAVRQLQTYLAESPVSCTPVGEPDYLGRVLGLCEQNGESLNERYVRSGFALAIETEMPEYAAAEAAAREEGIGLWQGQFQEPAAFRQSRGIMVTRP